MEKNESDDLEKKLNDNFEQAKTNGDNSIPPCMSSIMDHIKSCIQDSGGKVTGEGILDFGKSLGGLGSLRPDPGEEFKKHWDRIEKALHADLDKEDRKELKANFELVYFDGFRAGGLARGRIIGVALSKLANILKGGKSE